jgi:N-acetylneuraminic acid mutarotase
MNWEKIETQDTPFPTSGHSICNFDETKFILFGGVDNGKNFKNYKKLKRIKKTKSNIFI